MDAMIRCLPGEVQEALRSGVSIPSLQQCVEELVLNSIDAGATCVGVRLDMESLKVQVLDNGAGMSAEDMERVGNRYYTSKCSSLEDLDDLRSYGFRGEALASIFSLSTLVEITSRTRSSVKTHVKVFKSGKGLGVFEADAARPSAGTTVVISNFFHGMPVRRKRVDAVLEAERIRHRVEAISLIHPSVSVTLRNDCTGAMVVQLSKARDTHHRFAQIHGIERAQKLGEIRHTHGQFEVSGHVGKEGHYNNSLQFLYVNGRLLLKTRMHKLLNFLLRRLSSTNQRKDSPDGQSAIRSPKHKRSQELHGVYIINIKCSYSEYDICLEPAKTLIEMKDWDGILVCMEEAVKAFLSRENLVAVLSQDDLDSLSPALFCTDNTSREGNGASTLDHSIGMKLASESVHRARREDSVCQESVLLECSEYKSEKIPANDLETAQREGCVHKDCSDEPECDDTASDNNITEEEEKTFSSAQILCVSTKPESENPQFTKRSSKELQLNDASSIGNGILPESITQHIQPGPNSTEQLLDCQGAGGHRPSLISNRRISLSDPFVHRNLQDQHPSQINKSVFHQQNPAQKAEETSSTSKCKISLVTGQDRFSLKRCKDLAPVVLSKIPRIGCCQRLSLWNESGSLDKFRRIFGKSKESKLSSLETRIENNFTLPQTNSPTLNLQNLRVCQKNRQDGGDAETQKNETQSTFQSLPTLSGFTKLKPHSAQNTGKKSLAAKLCHLKQHEPVGCKVSVDISGTTSPTCLSGGNDVPDSNNNENPCDTSLSPEPDSACKTIPREEDITSGDWLHHYDASLGKTVYVNRVTGLSKYEDPEEEPQVRCTSDVTNMAVSVISETGMESRCYPFQVDLVLPFLSHSRTERVISSGLDGRDDAGENSLSSLYSKWSNPVFVQPPTVAVDISSGQADGLAVKIHNILFPYRFSKAMIQSMKVIHQVDKKFLACLINTREDEPAAQAETKENLLVLVDQHAAHERIRLENLVADSYEDDPNAPGERRLRSSNILPPLEINVTEGELRLLRSCQAHFQNLGLEVTFSEAADTQVFVGKVPLCFVERESNELKRRRPSVIKPIVEEYLREQIELLRSAGRVRGTLPLTVLKVLASIACHGAIKFNHSLSSVECHCLVSSLSTCKLPFQCAHGRPSMIPLVDILHLDKDQKELKKPNLQKLRRMHKAWELYGNR
ncbi:DNA mismatch repair protein Mlh3 isoform X1 [Pleuronectes platessa]|uniref:DNA mismatch repair protein Mlh3 isoform X1 n=1 Tax=Pleuronectes platessa TaxID=8262 RepID=UPI00232A3146|nr:DNA mismatch repair protein Mlh3 isoform X1 [Pleuronectes platessa]